MGGVMLEWGDPIVPRPSPLYSPVCPVQVGSKSKQYLII